MPTTLLIVYRVLGTVLFALAAAAIVEKYRTVRGAVLLPARVLECRRASSTSNSRGAGGYRYLVELYANGRRLELETNDAFWFRHDKDKGKVLQVWYNPNARCVERKSWETEFFAAVLAVIGAALLLYLEPYVTYDRDCAHLSLKKNAQDPDGTGATAALPEVSDAQIVYDEAQPGSDRIADLGGVYVTTQMLRDPKAVRAALEQHGACAVLLQLKSTFGNFYYSSSIDGAELADVDTAAVDSLIDWLSQHGYYLIAEVPAFCDTAFALANSAAALPLSSGALWMDSNGCYWLDPASETVMIYLKQIARELSSRGFREVVFSDFRFPASNSISYHSEKSGAELTQDAAQELTTFFSGSNLMISFETDDTAFPADVCTGRLYIRDVDGSKIEKFAQAYGGAENLTELVFLVNSKDTRFDERAVLRPLLNS